MHRAAHLFCGQTQSQNYRQQRTMKEIPHVKENKKEDKMYIEIKMNDITF
jgi:hypothetical protein